eukprot:g3707.t1
MSKASSAGDVARQAELPEAFFASGPSDPVLAAPAGETPLGRQIRLRVPQRAPPGLSRPGVPRAASSPDVLNFEPVLADVNELNESLHTPVEKLAAKEPLGQLPRTNEFRMPAGFCLQEKEETQGAPRSSITINDPEWEEVDDESPLKQLQRFAREDYLRMFFLYPEEGEDQYQGLHDASSSLGKSARDLRKSPDESFFAAGEFYRSFMMSRGALHDEPQRGPPPPPDSFNPAGSLTVPLVQELMLRLWEIFVDAFWRAETANGERDPNPDRLRLVNQAQQQLRRDIYSLEEVYASIISRNLGASRSHRKIVPNEAEFTFRRLHQMLVCENNPPPVLDNVNAHLVAQGYADYAPVKVHPSPALLAVGSTSGGQAGAADAAEEEIPRLATPETSAPEPMATGSSDPQKVRPTAAQLQLLQYCHQQDLQLPRQGLSTLRDEAPPEVEVLPSAGGVFSPPTTSSASDRRLKQQNLQNEVRARHDLLDPRYFKTRPCKFYEVGICAKGEKCEFAHGNEELQAEPDYYKTKICKAWRSGEGCLLGEKACPYAHGAAELRWMQRPRANKGKKRSKGTSASASQTVDEESAGASSSWERRVHSVPENLHEMGNDPSSPSSSVSRRPGIGRLGIDRRASTGNMIDAVHRSRGGGSTTGGDLQTAGLPNSPQLRFRLQRPSFASSVSTLVPPSEYGETVAEGEEESEEDAEVDDIIAQEVARLAYHNLPYKKI